jgi:hypothetical protein
MIEQKFVYEPEVIFTDDGQALACVKKDNNIVAQASIPDSVLQLEDEEQMQKELTKIAEHLMNTIQNMDVNDGKIIDL